MRSHWKICRAAAIVPALLLSPSGQSVAAAPAPPAREAVTVNPSTGTGRFLPPPQEIALPSEYSVFADFMRDMLESGNDKQAALKQLDDTLQRLPQPTRLRGFVQLSRAMALHQENEPEAIKAVEESIRLLPDYSGPLIAGSSIYAYGGRPDLAADYLIRASRIDPHTVRHLPDYEISNIFLRLNLSGDERRVGALGDRLLEIDWTGTRLSSRSALARDAIKRRFSDGDVDGARKLIPSLLIPAHSRELLAANAYQPIWADIEQWAGIRLDKQWQIYLREARQRWSASNDREMLPEYVDALLAAGHDQTILGEVHPLVMGKLDKESDYMMQFVIPRVAGALGRQGRWPDVDALFDHAEKVWPLGSDANALNVAANKGRYLTFSGRHHQALKALNAAIADADKRGTEVNSDALAAMHHYRACSLHALGRGDEAAASIAQVIASRDPTTIASIQLCLGNHKAARQALIVGLEDESKRDEVIGFVQLHSEPPLKSDYAIIQRQGADALRSDPQLLSQVAKYGRVVPYPANDGAPAE